MTSATLLLVATPLIPAVLLAVSVHPAARERLVTWLAFAPLPAVLAALLAGGTPPLVLDSARLRLTLQLDLPGAILLGATALVWSAAGAYAARYMSGDPRRARFARWWLLTLSGALGLFVARDLASFYLMFAILSLAAWGLVAHDGTARARRAGVLYLLLAVLGEICLLVAFALIATAAAGDSLALRDVLPSLPGAAGRDLIVALLVAGFGVKAGLVPLHVWLPIAHPAAPMPGSAVLSGTVIKAGIIGLLLFLPAEAGAFRWGGALAALGFAGALYAAAVGITQANPKTVLAYSSVSQMCLTIAVLGAGLASGFPGLAAVVALYAASHALAKGGLFLAVGLAATTARRRALLVLAPAALLALGFAGLPLTGGHAAKAAIKGPLADGTFAALATLSAVASAALMTQFLLRLGRAEPAGAERAPAGLLLPWLGLALAALAGPWLLLGPAAGVSVGTTLTAPELWQAAWPVGLGVVAGLLLRRTRLPDVPEGDVVVLGGIVAHASAAAGVALRRAESATRRWPVGTTLLLIVLLLLFAAAGLDRGGY